MKSPKAVIKEWVKAMNDQDVDKLMEFYHDDAVSVQVAIGTPLKGIAAIEADYTNLFEEKEWAILEWVGTGTYFKPGDAEGNKYTLRGCGFFQIINGKIIFQRGYWDNATWSKQIGVE